MNKHHRKRLALLLDEQVGHDDWRANAVLMRHVFGKDRFAASGALCFQTFDDHALFFDPRDDKIAMRLLSGRHWQRHFVQRAVTALQSANRDPLNSTLIDIGANIGSTLVYLMRDGGFGSAHAFEPEPDNARILARNVAENGLAGRTTCNPLALSNRDGQRELVKDAHNFGKHSLDGSVGASASGRIPVSAMTLDAYAETANLQPQDVGLIKIDVEGHELDVLAGMSSFLRARVPIMVEVSGLVGDPKRRAQLLELIDAYDRVLDLDDATGAPRALHSFEPISHQHELLIY
ncbi:MAG: FkbM family methyltransferase [Pseudomonadota bacterium]